MNWIILALSILGIGFFYFTKWLVARVNKRERIKHESNPAFVAANFAYEPIKMPWPFYAMLALAFWKLIESVAILSGACH